MRKLLVLTLWFFASRLTLFSSLILYKNTNQVKALNNLTASQSTFLAVSPSYSIFSALPQSRGDISASVTGNDARPLIIKNFLGSYSSPLANYSDFFVKTADKYQLDYRLLPSIAMQESNGGKKLPTDSYNAWGYGIYGDQVKRFTTWEEAIDRVGRGLKEDYINQGLTTPYQIMTKYTPPSLAKGGPWAKGVEYFFKEME